MKGYIPFHVMISMSSGCMSSICCHRTVIWSSQMNAQFLSSKWVKNHGETADDFF